MYLLSFSNFFNFQEQFPYISISIRFYCHSFISLFFVSLSNLTQHTIPHQSIMVFAVNNHSISSTSYPIPAFRIHFIHKPESFTHLVISIDVAKSFSPYMENFYQSNRLPAYTFHHEYRHNIHPVHKTYRLYYPNFL